MLLALSGGIDSVCLAHLLHESGIEFGIAHCNFQLRGTESDEDATFAEKLASHWGITYYNSSFDTPAYAKAHKLSVQMAARELRYAWFEALRQEKGYDVIATGHHLDDQVETFFINLMRGTGIAGLKGMPVKNGNIIRPLLFASRKEIEDYARRKEISYREDSSNQSLYYERNKIRHQLIPLLESMQDTFGSVMAGNFRRLREAEEIVRETVMFHKDKLLQREGKTVLLDIGSLKKLKPLNTYLYYFLQEFNFNPATVDKLSESLQYRELKVFYSDTHTLTKDRSFLRIEPTSQAGEEGPEDIFIVPCPSPTGSPPSPPRDLMSPLSFSISEPLALHFYVEDIPAGYSISKDENIAQLDPDKLTKPLTLRRWRQGDSFHPLGLKGKKKLSDFFTDEKFSSREKKECWLLCSGEDIVWVIGKRIDDRYKIRPSTKRILRITMI